MFKCLIYLFNISVLLETKKKMLIKYICQWNGCLENLIFAMIFNNEINKWKKLTMMLIDRFSMRSKLKH